MAYTTHTMQPHKPRHTAQVSGPDLSAAFFINIMSARRIRIHSGTGSPGSLGHVVAGPVPSRMIWITLRECSVRLGRPMVMALMAVDGCIGLGLSRCTHRLLGI